jgi:chromosomal replication initiator protein
VRNLPNVGLERTWKRVLERALDMSGEEQSSALRRLRLRALTAVEVRLEAPDSITIARITDDCLATLRGAVATVLGQRRLTIELPNQGEFFPDLGDRQAESRTHGLHEGLTPKYTFANFVVGASNQFAHAASMAVATKPGQHYNPLFIYGSAGLGKTHLATAIGHEVAARHPEARVVYLSSDDFMDDLIGSLRRDRMPEFKEHFRQVDLLILDDVQRLAGRERTQEEFFHTFNTLYDHRRQIVLTSDKLPKDIVGLEERLRNRLEWGLVADIQPPDVETRVAILQRKAEIEGVPLAPEVALHLGTGLTSNVRDLEAVLMRLGARASLDRRPVTVDLADEVLRMIAKPGRPAITFETIASAVCNHFSLQPSDLRSKRRSRNVARPRQLAMYLCRRLLNASFPHIGELFGRDHSTVIHATAVTERRIREDSAFHATVERLERTIREH